MARGRWRIGRRERVVEDEEGPGRVGLGRKRVDVEDAEAGVRRALGEEEAGPGEGARESGVVAEGDERRPNSEPRLEVEQQHPRAAVDVGERDDPVARLQQAEDDPGEGPHPRAEQDRVLRPVERGELRFDGLEVGVAVPRVEPGALTPGGRPEILGRVEAERARSVDRGVEGPGRRVGPLSTVHRPRSGTVAHRGEAYTLAHGRVRAEGRGTDPCPGCPIRCPGVEGAAGAAPAYRSLTIASRTEAESSAPA